MTKTPSERYNAYRRQDDLERRMFAEDVDSALLLDRPTRLTKWTTR